jgi:hypothetical protein
MSILLASVALVPLSGIAYAQTTGGGNATSAVGGGNATSAVGGGNATSAVGGGNATGGQWKTFDLKVGSQTRPVQYMIMNGTVDNITISGQNSTLGISFKSTNDGMLTVRLPRDLIDSKTPQGNDTGFNVFIDNAELVEPNENATTSNIRTISIGFPAGSTAIDIIGTMAVPEFSTIAIVVMTIAIVGIIIATARHSRFNFTRRL